MMRLHIIRGAHAGYPVLNRDTADAMTSVMHSGSAWRVSIVSVSALHVMGRAYLANELSI